MPAVAQEVGDTTIGGGLSIFGVTVESTYQIEPDLRLRGVAMGGFNFDDTDTDDDGNTYDIDLNIAAAALLVDHYPSGPGWRVSGGLLINLSDLSAEGRGEDTEPFEINGETFDGGIVTGDARFANELAPMVTAGYDYDFGNNSVPRLARSTSAVSRQSLRPTVTRSKTPSTTILNSGMRRTMRTISTSCPTSA
jgi:hypothetical protein